MVKNNRLSILVPEKIETLNFTPVPLSVSDKCINLKRQAS